MNRSEIANVVSGDMSPEFEARARDVGVVAWDIETNGLDWSINRIATCQLHVPNAGTEIVRIGRQRPDRHADLLASQKVTKVFHHAPFDLRFMRYQWGTRPRAVACTKILAKIVRPGRDAKAYSLKPLADHFLDVELDKSQQVSNWFANTLTDEQLTYAAKDVLYLVPLFERLMVEAQTVGVADIVEATFAYLPTRIETDLRRCGDVFAY